MVLNILYEFFLVGDLISLLLGSSLCGPLSKSIKKTKTKHKFVSVLGREARVLETSVLCSLAWTVPTWRVCGEGTFADSTCTRYSTGWDAWGRVTCCHLPSETRCEGGNQDGSAQLESWNSIRPSLAYCKAPSSTSCISFPYFQQILFM